MITKSRLDSCCPQLFFEIAIRVFDYNEDFSQNMLLDFPVTYAIPFQVSLCIFLFVFMLLLSPFCKKDGILKTVEIKFYPKADLFFPYKFLIT